MAKKQRIYQVRVTLKGSKPPIWRKLAVPSDILLGELHEVLQIAMGWTDGHLHQFRQRLASGKPSPQEIARHFQQGTMDEAFMARMQGVRYFVTKVTPWGDPTDMEGEDEDAFALEDVCKKVKSKLVYEYDFGDNWEHDIEVQKIFEPEPGVEYPVCLGGKKACPPEDCGGIWGFYNMLEAITDPKHPEHEKMLEWIGDEFDPEEFDLEEVNKTLADWRKEMGENTEPDEGC